MKKRKKSLKSRHYKVYQFLGIVLLCLILFFLSYQFTMAWFVDQSTTSNGEPNILVVGTVDLRVQTNFNFYNLVLAPDMVYTENIEDGQSVSYATRLTTSTKNDTGSIYVRAKFYTNRPELSLHFTNLTTATSFVDEETGDTESGKWFYNEEDDFYYYLGSVGTSEVIFNAGYYVDNTLDNSKAGDEVEINFTFEAIQRPFGAYSVVWDSAPTIFDEFAVLDSGY